MRAVWIALLLAFLVLLLAMLWHPQPVLEIHNESFEPVSSVDVEVAGRHTKLAGIQPGETRQDPLALRADGPLRVRVRFAGGQSTAANGGYFTPGMRGANRLDIVSPDSVAVTTR
jgi:hypothetical protein